MVKVCSSAVSPIHIVFPLELWGWLPCWCGEGVQLCSVPCGVHREPGWGGEGVGLEERPGGQGVAWTQQQHTGPCLTQVCLCSLLVGPFTEGVNTEHSYSKCLVPGPSFSLIWEVKFISGRREGRPGGRLLTSCIPLSLL